MRIGGNTTRRFDIYNRKHPSKGRDNTLIGLVYDNEEFFSDMLFAEDSITGKFITCQVNVNGDWIDDTIPLPDYLRYFSYSDFFKFRVKKLPNGFLGCFNSSRQTLYISPSSLKDDSVILHEMIHLHEFVLSELPLYYRDVLFYCLYSKLKIEIPDLNKRLEEHGHVMNEQEIGRVGGLHDILFLLKSYDLDLKKGYSLGTVFGYGYGESKSSY